jgi:hypothetical protein
VLEYGLSGPLIPSIRWIRHKAQALPTGFIGFFRGSLDGWIVHFKGFKQAA